MHAFRLRAVAAVASADRLPGPCVPTVRSRTAGAATALLAVAIALTGAGSAGAAGDLPPATPNLELIPAGSLVIPMDSAKQNLGGSAFNLKAYGLMTQILWAEIPVKWVIRAGKLKDGVDFTAQVSRVLPSSGSVQTLSFSGGPFVVHRDFVPAALPLIAPFGGSVAVYRLEADTTVDVRYTLLHKPKVAVLNDGGHAEFHVKILDAAGFVPGVQYGNIGAATLATINANSCYTIASEAHWDDGSADPQVQAVGQFLRSSGNFLAQCVAITTYENNAAYGRFQTTLGLTKTGLAGPTYAYPSPDLSFSQFDGELQPISGSVHQYTLAPGSSFQNGAHDHVLYTATADARVASVSKLTAGLGSMVFYLGGHDYDGRSRDEINGLRMYLNAVMTPAVRPPACELNFVPVPGIAGHVLEDVDGDGDLADATPRPGAAVTLYQDGGDGLPTGADDVLVLSATTDGTGRYGFEGIPIGVTYWVTVASRTVTASAGLRGGASDADTWAEQTWGPAGGLCDNGTGGVGTLAAPGSCFGGRDSTRSDASSGLAGREHVARVPLLYKASNVDFAFSFAVVGNTRDGDDDGNASPRTVQGSLRQFLLNGNALAGVQRSRFHVPTSSTGHTAGTWRIAPTTDLPTVTDPVALDGSTQPGFAGAPVVEIDGSLAQNGGLVIDAGGSTIRSLAINRARGPGITLESNGNNTVAGCFVGTDVAGTADQGNGDVGILVRSDGNTIGGAQAAARNVISGNRKPGVKLDTGATGNSVLGNYIGTDATGAAALGNADIGVDVRGPGNTVGGTAAGAGNVVAGNANGGIRINNAAAGTIVQGNRIGTDASGTRAIANRGPGIDLRASSCVIGGAVPAARNVISGNSQNGIDLSGASTTGNRIEGNFIGTDLAGVVGIPNALGGVLFDNASENMLGGTGPGSGNLIAFNGGAGVAVVRNATGNSIRGNSVHDNVALGIDLESDGVTPNDTGDADTGPNGLQNFPVLSAVTVSSTTTSLSGTLSGPPSAAFTLDFFANTAADPSEHGEGQRYLGSGTATTDASGIASFLLTVPSTVLGGEVVTATVTAADGSTSEFSSIFTFVSVGGTVYEDPNGDGDVADGAPRPGAVVRIYRDGGDGLPSGADDTAYGTTTTDASGAYRFQGVVPGMFWVTVDSRTVSPSGGISGGFTQGDLWPEQSHGPAGAQCDNGTGGIVVLSAPGPCYGGRRRAVSDTASALATSEHIARVEVAQTAIGGIDFGFAFHLVVNTKDGDDDPGAGRTIQGSLRQLVQNGNAAVGPGSGVFRIPTSDPFFNRSGNGEYAIFLTSPLPAITDPLTLDGATQPGFSGRPIVQVSGKNAGNLAIGFRIVSSGSVLRGLIVDAFRGDGIDVTGSGNRVEGCYVGTTVTGAAASSNSGHGLLVTGPDNTIGGTSTGAGNVISGNGLDGVSIAGAGATGNLVRGNRIGVNATGTAAVKNDAHGVETSAGAASNSVGGPSSGEANLISGNGGSGIRITGAGSSGNRIEGNRIGTDATGTLAVRNGDRGLLVDLGAASNVIGGSAAGAGNLISGNRSSGIEISGSGTDDNRVLGNLIGTDVTGTGRLGNGDRGILVTLGASRNVLGGTDSAAGNVIAASADAGIEISSGSTGITLEGNRIGTDRAGTLALGNAKTGVLIRSGSNTLGGTAPGTGNIIAWNQAEGVVVRNAIVGNAILGNSIHDNIKLGIDLNQNGVTANDLGDIDAGPNDLQNYPVLGAASTAGGTTVVTGGLNSRPGASFRLEFFASTTPDLSSYGEGQTFLGSQSGTTDASGNLSFTAVLPVAVAAGTWITATATSSGSSTSEFSAGVVASLRIDLSLRKQVDDPTPAFGGTVVFTLTVENAPGSGDATGVIVTDALPAGFTYLGDDSASSGTSYAPASGAWAVGDVRAGTAKSLTITAQVNSTGPWRNAAEVTAAAQADIDSTPGDGIGDDYAAVEVAAGAAIDLSLTKSVDAPAPAIGANVVFSVTVSNAADASSATAVVVTDRLPAGYTYLTDDSASTLTAYVAATGAWTVGAMPSGSSKTLTITARVNPAGPYLNEAEVTGAGRARRRLDARRPQRGRLRERHDDTGRRGGPRGRKDRGRSRSPGGRHRRVRDHRVERPRIERRFRDRGVGPSPVRIRVREQRRRVHGHDVRRGVGRVDGWRPRGGIEQDAAHHRPRAVRRRVRQRGRGHGCEPARLGLRPGRRDGRRFRDREPGARADARDRPLPHENGRASRSQRRGNRRVRGDGVQRLGMERCHRRRGRRRAAGRIHACERRQHVVLHRVQPRHGSLVRRSAAVGNEQVAPHHRQGQRNRSVSQRRSGRGRGSDRHRLDSGRRRRR